MKTQDFKTICNIKVSFESIDEFWSCKYDLTRYVMLSFESEEYLFSQQIWEQLSIRPMMYFPAVVILYHLVWGGRLYSAKADVESYIWAEITPRSSMGWGHAAWAGAGLVCNLVNVSAVCPSDKGQLHPGLYSKPVASRLTEVTLSLYFWSILASSLQRRHYHGGPTRGHQDELGGWRPSQGKGGLQGCCMALWLPKTQHSHCSWSLSASLSRCFSVVRRRSLRSNRHKLQQGKFQLDTGKKILQNKSGQMRGKIVWEIMESPSPGLLKTWQDISLRDLLLQTLVWTGDWNRYLQKSIPVLVIQWFCVSLQFCKVQIRCNTKS